MTDTPTPLGRESSLNIAESTPSVQPSELNFHPSPPFLSGMREPIG